MINKTFYNNIPPDNPENSASTTLKFFDQFYQVPIEINGNSLTAVKGFFESRGFGESAAETIAVIILSQAKKDKINEFQIIDTLTGLSQLQLSGLVGEILNFNRFKSSSLGLTPTAIPANEIQRNILA
jgi:hypothetical protein